MDPYGPQWCRRFVYRIWWRNEKVVEKTKQDLALQTPGIVSTRIGWERWGFRRNRHTGSYSFLFSWMLNRWAESMFRSNHKKMYVAWIAQSQYPNYKIKPWRGWQKINILGLSQMFHVQGRGVKYYHYHLIVPRWPQRVLRGQTWAILISWEAWLRLHSLNSLASSRNCMNWSRLASFNGKHTLFSNEMSRPIFHFVRSLSC